MVCRAVELSAAIIAPSSHPGIMHILFQSQSEHLAPVAAGELKSRIPPPRIMSTKLRRRVCFSEHLSAVLAPLFVICMHGAGLRRRLFKS